MFIPNFWSIGAAISTLISELLVTGIQFYYIRKEFNLREVFGMSLKYLISGIIMAIVLIFSNKVILAKNNIILRIGLNIILGIIIYLSSLITFKDKFTLKITNKIKGIKNESNI